MSDDVLRAAPDDADGSRMIVVGYSADRFGAAAVEHGIAEAKLRDSSLLVINATEGESYVDPRFAGSGQIVDLETHLADAHRYPEPQPRRKAVVGQNFSETDP